MKKEIKIKANITEFIKKEFARGQVMVTMVELSDFDGGSWKRIKPIVNGLVGSQILQYEDGQRYTKGDKFYLL